MYRSKILSVYIYICINETKTYSNMQYQVQGHEAMVSMQNLLHHVKNKDLHYELKDELHKIKRLNDTWL